MHKGLKCPLLNKDCIRDKCAWWVQMFAKDLKTQEMKDASNCVIVKSMELQLETLHRTVGVQQAIESTRNENVERQDQILKMVSFKNVLSKGEL